MTQHRSTLWLQTTIAALIVAAIVAGAFSLSSSKVDKPQLRIALSQIASDAQKAAMTIDLSSKQTDTFYREHLDALREDVSSLQDKLEKGKRSRHQQIDLSPAIAITQSVTTELHSALMNRGDSDAAKRLRDLADDAWRAQAALK